ncbi:MAG: hypothetical protein GY768_21550 [Planctomycetaceae bacterium]|nr:hypothetical protein [Planctomycetaceae bacterium]
MRGKMLGLFGGVLVTGIVLGTMADHRDVHAQPARGSDSRMQSADGVTAIQGTTVNGQQLIVLIDDQKQTMGSYFVDEKSGQISLRCIRNFGWDLQMSEFNGAEPSPEQIQALIRSR